MDRYMDFISQFAVSLDAIRGAAVDTTRYLNAHRHGDDVVKGEVAVINRYPGEVRPDDEYVCCGIHPWHVDDDWHEKLDILRLEALKPNVVAVGECGLDKAVSRDLTQQMEAFRQQVLLAEQVGKPMVIHCVKAFDELLAIHKAMRPMQKWLIHGFRGKPEQAKQIMAKGLLLSFGHRYNIESLRYVASALGKLYIETDDSSLSIIQVYDQIACHLSSGNLD